MKYKIGKKSMNLKVGSEKKSKIITYFYLN